ncbi:hypothetical protein GCM10011352_05060 [Marinobacterium zhoushanense]|uniref:Uncharacterized protein n=1 Tax=Marinobacterium zhoushanense TaxID=1679163 RepID=A0ABQ1K095_9GAMM|nr:hypothetical protein [Marinobacterium zhoushanense]GGB82239.1 hypothetical protein GCM10011352_05060 [Marinobacterium zhoushanense]
MNYDFSFDQARLNQLADQYLEHSSVTGRILFLGSSTENRLDLATWQLNTEEDYEAFTCSGFKLQVMELLDTLMTYRAQHKQPNASQGVIHINGSRLSIEWLPKYEVEAMRNNVS